MAAIHIICHLGIVSSPDDDVEVELGEAAPNSNKWIFDVDQDTDASPGFVFELRDAKSGKVKEAKVLSVTLTPLTAEAAGARLRVLDPFTPQIEIGADNVGAITYRVTVDAIHSLVR